MIDMSWEKQSYLMKLRDAMRWNAAFWKGFYVGIVCAVSVLFLFFLLFSGWAWAGDLPDPKITPGVANPAVTEKNILGTICVKGWTKTVRPPAKYTDALKRKQLRQYGFADQNPKDYEEDHYIPLELGGHPRDPKNLWPQHRLGACNAAQKDRLENKLHELVCASHPIIGLRGAQVAIAEDWTAAYRRFVDPNGCAHP